jgi:hypothetical protein
MNGSSTSSADAIADRASFSAARFNAASDIIDTAPPYADLDDAQLSSCMAEMESVIDGMARMGMGTSHESRLLATMKEEQDRRAA